MIPAITFGFISGILIASFFHISGVYFYAFFGLVLVCFLYRYKVDGDDRKRLTLVTVFLIFILVGVLRVNISNLYSVSKLSEFEDKKVEVVGVVVAEPDVREKNTKLTIKTEEVIFKGSVKNIQEKILVTVPIYPEHSYGDRVSASVVLTKPTLIESEDGRVFDYEGYLKVRGIWYTSRYSSVELISTGNGNSIKTLLFKTKRAFTDSINNILPEPQSSLLAGLLLGTKQSLGKEILTEFQRTGTSHIVVLSGYNIAIVAESIMNALNFLPKNVSFSFGAAGIILFTMLSGAGASGVRAAIMVLVALFAKRFNRDYKANRVLGFTIVLMLAPNPLLLVFDPSFQLSVLATIGLIFVSPILEPYFKGVTEKFGLREILATTIATQITVLPFLIYNTGLLSLVSIPVNVLILSTIPLTMFLGFITGIFGLVNFYLSVIPAFFTFGLLWYQLKIVHVGSALSFGAINLSAFSPIFLIIIYGVIFIGLYKIKKKV
ncbi:MAG: competence protein ComEC [Parcubacteria bacterium C7867-003]|nr:MAG: competence protein ComEC [Parcubacteria bacterium C7867-003]